MKIKRLKLRKNHARSAAGNVINMLILIAISVFMVAPLVYIISSAFKPLDELFMFPPRFFVIRPTLNNFYSLGTIMADSWVPFSRYVSNTLIITIVSTTFHVLVASMAAYVLEKRNFRGKKIFFKVIILSLMFSPAVTGIPNFIVMSKIGWINSLAALIVPAIGAPIGVFLMKQFMASSVPNVLIEAARIDGCSEIRTFFQIVMPLVKPAWLTLIIFSFQRLWAITGDGVIFSEELKPLNYAMHQVVNGGIARVGAGSAVALLMIIPPIMVYIFSQTQILSTMASSGIKE